MPIFCVHRKLAVKIFYRCALVTAWCLAQNCSAWPAQHGAARAPAVKTAILIAAAAGLAVGAFGVRYGTLSPCAAFAGTIKRQLLLPYFAAVSRAAADDDWAMVGATIGGNIGAASIDHAVAGLRPGECATRLYHIEIDGWITAPGDLDAIKRDLARSAAELRRAE